MKRVKHGLQGAALGLMACFLIGTGTFAVPLATQASGLAHDELLEHRYQYQPEYDERTPAHQWVWIVITVGVGLNTVLLFDEPHCSGFPSRFTWAAVFIGETREWMDHYAGMGYKSMEWMRRCFNL